MAAMKRLRRGYRGARVPKAAVLATALGLLVALPALAQASGAPRPPAAGADAAATAQAAAADFAAELAALSRRSADNGFVELSLSFVRSRRSLSEALSSLDALAPLAPAERRAPLVRERAALLQAAGRWLEAAEAWQELARLTSDRGAQPELVASALCLLYAGDIEKARFMAEAAGLSTQDRELRALAALVVARARAAAGETEPALQAAREMIDGVGPAQRLAALRLAASLAEGQEKAAYERRIEAEFGGVSGGSEAFLALLGAEADAGWKHPEAAAPAGGAAGGAAQAPVPAGGAASSAQGAVGTSGGPTHYQVGAFRDQANAQLVANRLNGLGFSASLRSRSDDRGAVFTVVVPAGSDPGATLLRIKDAGFEAWPLF